MSAPRSHDGSRLLYRERLAVPLRWWVQGTMFVASIFLAVVVALPSSGALIVTVIAAAVVYGGMAWFGSAVVEVHAGDAAGEGVLAAGRGRLPLGVVTGVEELDRDRTRAVAGREADARAFLVLRGWLKQSVRVHLDDPRDPTPYWLVSTRHPARLVAALDQAGQTGPVTGSHGAPPAG